MLVRGSGVYAEVVAGWSQHPSDGNQASPRYRIDGGRTSALGSQPRGGFHVPAEITGLATKR